MSVTTPEQRAISIERGYNLQPVDLPVEDIHCKLASLFHPFELRADRLTDFDLRGANNWSITEIVLRAQDGARPEHRDIVNSLSQMQFIDFNSRVKEVLYTIFELLPGNITELLNAPQLKYPGARKDNYEHWVLNTVYDFYTPLLSKAARFGDAQTALKEAQEKAKMEVKEFVHQASEVEEPEKEVCEATQDFENTLREVKTAFMNTPEDFQKLCLAHSLQKSMHVWLV
eukprot:Protomagalhaensia_wolfi_Nauph_80__995@NODE_1575_length_1459_cov_105_814085_g1220_i0_p1_GENE_NODE_1575_length_1459_cov_105_814085_g1220_i0NODE_1575_length_1459_cov_105_814085_g1220_i0_p1_ORF_typecomplete_len229_score48_12CEP63/PF17045_5/0_029RIGI_C/PF18119_1/17RIGI_C/PF18119_1/7_6BORCS8/PF10167_9/0_26_NODE_1575_length_1459_cov_105_814085_g1220_i06151301